MNTTKIELTEKPLRVIRRHPIIYLFIGIYIFFLIFISILIIIFSKNFIGILGEKIFWTILTVFWILFSSIIFVIWTNFELDFLIITNTKIIIIQQISFLNKEILEIEFSKIQEIKSKISGILPTLFNYGEISIKSAANSENITLKYIKNPSEITQFIHNIAQKSEKIL